MRKDSILLQCSQETAGNRTFIDSLLLGDGKVPVRAKVGIATYQYCTVQYV